MKSHFSFLQELSNYQRFSLSLANFHFNIWNLEEKFGFLSEGLCIAVPLERQLHFSKNHCSAVQFLEILSYTFLSAFPSFFFNYLFLDVCNKDKWRHFSQSAKLFDTISSPQRQMPHHSKILTSSTQYGLFLFYYLFLFSLETFHSNLLLQRLM